MYKQQLDETKVRFQTELDAKQQMLNALTGQLSQLTTNMTTTESRTANTIRTQCDMQYTKYIETQNLQHQNDINKIDEDNRKLVAEMNETKS